MQDSHDKEDQFTTVTHKKHAKSRQRGHDFQKTACNLPAERGSAELDGHLNSIDTARTSTVVCYKFADKGVCNYGNACRYSHSQILVQDWRDRREAAATQPCEQLQKFGKCKYGKNCWYNHAANDLPQTSLQKPLGSSMFSSDAVYDIYWQIKMCVEGNDGREFRLGGSFAQCNELKRMFSAQVSQFKCTVQPRKPSPVELIFGGMREDGRMYTHVFRIAPVPGVCNPVKQSTTKK